MGEYVIVKLEHILNISKGQNYSRLYSKNDFNDKNLVSIKLLRESYVKKGYIEISDDLFSNSLNLSSKLLNNKNIEKNFTKLGDIIVRAKKPCYAALIEQENANKLVDTECFILRDIDNSINKYYLLSYLNSKNCLDNVKQLQTYKDSEKVNLSEYKLLEIPILKSKFEMEQIGHMYKELIEKKTLFIKISDVEDSINNKRFEEIIGDNYEK